MRVSYGQDELVVARKKVVWEIHKKASKIIASNGGTDLYKGRE
jgi:hypothetical protein